MRVLITESGARYEISGDRIRRVEGNDGNTKRRDGEWLRLLEALPDDSLVGMRLFLVLETLAASGPDDYGTENPDPVQTTRVTTPVVVDEWIPA